MSSIKHLAALLGVSALMLDAFIPAHGASKPIVDVRFDGPFFQVDNSYGDEWAPSWGPDDILYTGNDDGSSFGGVPINAIAFGKVVGDQPGALKGITINGMAEYKQVPVPGPEGAIWKTLHSYPLDGQFYRFGPCGQDGQSSCLMRSEDGGKSWSKTRTSFQASVLQDPSFITFQSGYARIDAIRYGKDFNDYAYISGYLGLIDGEDHYVIARVAKARLAQSNPDDWSFSGNKGRVGGWIKEPEKAASQVNSLELGPDMANWKTMNSYSVDGVLYMFVTRCIYPWNGNDPKHRHIFRDSSIIKSTDKGLTWTRPADDNFRQPMFPGKRFGTPYFIWYGKDGAASVDNADKYVYAVSNDGYFEAGDNYIVGRVARSKLGNLSASDWTFWKSGDGMSDSSWTSDLNAAQPVLSNAGKSSMTGMTYIGPLGRYVMVQWHFRAVSWETVLEKKEFSTGLDFYESPKPWGPWTKFKTYETGIPGWYVPIVGQRFQKAINADSASAYMFAPGFMNEGNSDLYKLNYMPVTFSVKPLEHKVPTYIGGR
jgi:hypothetical protein